MVVSPRATLFGYPWMDTLAHEYIALVERRGFSRQEIVQLMRNGFEVALMPDAPSR